MTHIILSLKNGRDRGSFMKEAVQAGVKLKEFPFLPRHFEVEGHQWTVETFPLNNHPAILTIDDGGHTTEPATQNIIIDETFQDGNNWSLPRVIRRDAPWGQTSIKTPFNTFFRCVRDGTGVDIYIFDTGIRPTHVEFGSRVTAMNVGANFHGTLMAGFAAGNTRGFARGANIFSYLIGTTSGSSSALITGISEMIANHDGRNNPAVANLSFTPTFTSTANQAISDAIESGITFVNSAANDMDLLTSSDDPTAYVTDITTVGAISPFDTPAYGIGGWGTCYGDAVDILAPGMVMDGPSHSSDTGYITTTVGTSGATACTTGVIACMLQGKAKTSTRAHVQAVRNALFTNATTGRYQAITHLGHGFLPDRILYLDPDITSEPITGL